MPILSEDDRYRTSTQYRLWSYTPAALYALRTTTNQNAAARVRDAVQRARNARAVSTSTPEGERSRAGSSAPDTEIDCLTVEEEQMLVTHGCQQLLGLGDALNMPTDVKSTAVQYFKRFYLTNSVMTYNSPDILMTALYFATKTECHYTRLTDFARAIPAGKKTVTPEQVLASEFLLTQGLRFTFDVRHPFRALTGAMMELEAIAKYDIPALPGGGPVLNKPDNMRHRVLTAGEKAKEYLKTSAIISDAYFHFTPSQIMMACIWIADEGLAEWYIATKFILEDADSLAMMKKVFNTIVSCAQMILSLDKIPAVDAELRAKLKKCRNPEKIDLVGLQRAKREGQVEQDEKVIKKRKLERQQSAQEGEDLFGPSLK